jgi:hypothetical protein
MRPGAPPIEPVEAYTASAHRLVRWRRVPQNVVETDARQFGRELVGYGDDQIVRC